ncbi:SH3 domain-containing protein [Arvimicrobium flavum]|uniref:SH3 domain-containing protein n=1 Tax=Arvimicrobium flavum TaxID=3393320 RepID=UPI00237BC038|nr:SH3 domain-containing protein [Mesorhizobium shangrilense]
MPRTPIAAAFAYLLASISGLHAQEGDASGPQFFVVTGLAPGDELNVRATASPTGMLIGRLPNGSQLRNLGCSEINGAQWCKVEDVHSSKLAGWAPARYLEGAGGSALASVSEDVAGDSSTLAEPAEPEFDATGDIPCARYFGQPMSACQAGVSRGSKGEAEVLVVWPDGGERIIRFRNGEPDSSDATEDIRFTRESDLHMIRIGKSERFEIPNALAFGG